MEVFCAWILQFLFIILKSYFIIRIPILIKIQTISKSTQMNYDSHQYYSNDAFDFDETPQVQQSYLLQSFNERQLNDSQELFPSLHKLQPSPHLFIGPHLNTQYQSKTANSSKKGEQNCKVKQFKLENTQRHATQGNKEYYMNQKTISKFVGDVDRQKVKGKRRVVSQLQQIQMADDFDYEGYFDQDSAEGDLSQKYLCIQMEAKMMSECELNPKTRKNDKLIKRIKVNPNVHHNNTFHKNIGQTQKKTNKQQWEIIQKQLEQQLKKSDKSGRLMRQVNVFIDQMMGKYEDMVLQMGKWADLKWQMEEIIKKQQRYLRQYQYEIQKLDKRLNQYLLAVEVMVKKPMMLGFTNLINFDDLVLQITSTVKNTQVPLKVNNQTQVSPKISNRTQLSPKISNRTEISPPISPKIINKGIRQQESSIDHRKVNKGEVNTNDRSIQKRRIIQTSPSYVNEQQKPDSRTINDGDESYRKIIGLRIKQLQSDNDRMRNQLQGCNVKYMVVVNQNKQLRNIVEGLIEEIRKQQKIKSCDFKDVQTRVYSHHV